MEVEDYVLDDFEADLAALTATPADATTHKVDNVPGEGAPAFGDTFCDRDVDASTAADIEEYEEDGDVSDAWDEEVMVSAQTIN